MPATPTATKPEPTITAAADQPESLTWLWLLLTASAALIVVFNFLAFIPVGVLWTGVGIAKKRTAAGPRTRAAGNGLLLAGLAMAGVTTVLLLLLTDLTGGRDPVLTEDPIVDEVSTIALRDDCPADACVPHRVRPPRATVA
jgi:hypothetical protein